MSFPPIDRKTMSVFSAAAVSFFSTTLSMPSQRSDSTSMNKSRRARDVEIAVAEIM